MHLLLLTTTVACAAAAITVVVDGRTHVLEAASGDDASAVAANFVAAHSLDGGGVCGGSAACVSQQLEAALAAATDPPPPPPPPLLAPPAAVTEAGRALVVYAYHETPSARANLRFFLKHGLLPRAQADTVVVTHGCHTVDFPEGVAVVEDPNVGHDMGAYRCVFAVGPSPSHVPSHQGGTAQCARTARAVRTRSISATDCARTCAVTPAECTDNNRPTPPQPLP